MIMNLPIVLSKETEAEQAYYELKIGRQVVASSPMPKDTTDARALAALLDKLPRS